LKGLKVYEIIKILSCGKF